MPVDVSQFYRSLDQFQDAAVEPERWPLLMESISVASGAAGVNIMSPAERSSVCGILFTDSLARIMEAYLRDEWYTRDHRARFIPLMKRRGVVLEADIASSEDIQSLEYYRFMASHGFQQTAVINFTSGTDDFFLVLQRRYGDGGFEDRDRAHFVALQSQLQTSSRIMSLFSNSEMIGRLAAFERANVPCVFFDRQGRVVASNERAERLQSDGIRILNKKLVASSPKETSNFEALLRKVIHAPEQASGEVLVFSRPANRPILARIERVQSNLKDVFSRAHIMALFEDLAAPNGTDPDVLHRLFGLTRSECRIAALLLQGSDLKAISDDLGIQYETARAHLKSIFRKTETERQAELCLLLTRVRLG
ncbi:helix-turn-helix transcriptional regulator [Agrobacterium tumefaciens]|uniref:helix-turn-helix transcriptional regulator n=1 Tax=Agrobacterium tumefaciens TaxID=358 RepID=UPI0021CEE69C|nr:helix-turn-helix transcriptional regulator [Agrobacterium tumefaciens]UXS05302.1 helix-turn-helix transcriptional regulator [Agrobacterium tumefaciens]